MTKEIDAEKISRQLEDLNNAVLNLQGIIKNQDKKIKNLEKKSSITPAASRADSPHDNLVSKEYNIFGGPVESPAAAKSSHKKTKSIDLEEKIGGNWFAKIGIAVLILGVSFFLKYAFDNWMGPTAIVLTSALVGVILLAIGEFTIKKYSQYSQMLAGGGIVILYLSVFVAYSFYHLINYPPALLLMAAVTSASIFLSIRHDAMPLLLVSVIGGFATPFLISSGENNYLALFSYIIILDLAILAVSFLKKWRLVNIAGFLGTVLVFSAWHEKFYDPPLLFPTIFFLTVFFVIYTFASLIYNIIKQEKSSGAELVLTILTALFYFSASYAMLNPKYEAYLGLFAALIAVYYLIAAYLIKKTTPADSSLYEFLAVLASVFTALAIFLQFEQNIITLVWAIEALLLFYVGIRNKNEVIRISGAIILGLAVFRHILVDYESYSEIAALLLNKVFFTTAAIIAILYLIAYLFKKYQIDGKSIFAPAKKIISIFLILANILTLVSITADISSYYANKAKELRKEWKLVDINEAQSESAVINKNQKIEEEISLINNKSNSVLSFFWLTYAIILIIAGCVKNYRNARIGGAALLLFIAIKLFLYDFWATEKFYRIIIALYIIFNSYLAAYLFKAFSIDDKDDIVPTKRMVIIFGSLANVVTIGFISREIVAYYSNIVQQLPDDTANEIINNIKNKSGIVLSLFWLLYGVAAMVIGLIYKYKFIRLGAILLLLLALLKLFFYDLWYIGTLYRIVSSISLGVALLSISFAYNKYSHKIKEII